LNGAREAAKLRVVSETRLYPEIEPYNSGKLSVSGEHSIYWEESGNPKGKPVVFLHGGPGGGTEPKHRRFFDPARYRIVLFDQRGCGKSTPHASLEDNTTWHLVDDIEALREHLKIEKWQVFGGSWGSTLGLAYAQKHADRVAELVLRGIFTFAQDEMDWFYRDGTRVLFPDAYDQFMAALPESERDDPVASYHRRLTSDDRATREAAARAWSMWECRVATLIPDDDLIAHCEDASFTLAFARIECHYFVNNGFLDTPTQLVDEVAKIRHIPGVIVHGRYDVICPARNAWRLHKAWPESKLVLVPSAGHSANEPGIVKALIDATDRFAGG
jgi:proline iminopeptidase